MHIKPHFSVQLFPYSQQNAITLAIDECSTIHRLIGQLWIEAKMVFGIPKVTHTCNRSSPHLNGLQCGHWSTGSTIYYGLTRKLKPCTCLEINMGLIWPATFSILSQTSFFIKTQITFTDQQQVYTKQVSATNSEFHAIIY